MAVYLVGATNGHPSQSKFIQSCSTVLVSMVATYLTLMVLVECTVRVILLKFGIETRGMNAAATANHQQLRNQEDEQERSAALERRFAKSLRDIGYEHNDDDDNHNKSESDKSADVSCSAAAGCASACCAERCKIPIASAKGNCCSICLEDFQPGDAVVSGRKECCNSNLFHEDCIKTWLRINDSCPCCRSPMLEEEKDESKTSSSTQPRADRGASEGHAGYFRSQFRIKIDTATRLRNEILSYYLEATTDPHALSHGSQRHR
jgi:hypothetical protein